MDTKFTDSQTAFFLETRSRDKAPMVDSKAVEDKAQLCRKDKLCRINTAGFRARIRVGYSGNARYLQRGAVIDHIFGKKERAFEPRTPSVRGNKN